MSKEKEMNPSSQMVFDMAKIFLDIQTSSFASGMKHAKEDAERERKLQAFADKCERDLGEKPIKMYKVTIIWGTDREDKFPIHTIIYDGRPEIKAIIHL